MKTFRLHGELAGLFGAEHKLEVRTPAEALRLIDINQPGLIDHIVKSAESGVGYRVVVGDRDLEADELGLPTGREIVHFVPVHAGAKKGGIIIGALMVAAAIYTGGASLTWSAALAQGGSALLSKIAFSIGTSLLFSGVSQMLAGTPETPSQGFSPGDEKPSYYFNGPAENTAQGSAVAVGYGELLIGSQPISTGLVAEELVA